MFYGVEQSTDLRDRRTQIVKFNNISALEKWMKNSGRFTHENPEAARNHHHTFRYGYELKGRINFKDKIFADSGSRTYPRNKNDNLATYLFRNGREIET